MDLTVQWYSRKTLTASRTLHPRVSEEFCHNCITYTRGFGCRLRDGSLKMESVKRTTGAGYDRREEVGICIIYISIFGSVGRLFLPTNITHSSFHDQSLFHRHGRSACATSSPLNARHSHASADQDVTDSLAPSSE
jgi:hypothetical protein